MGKDNLHVQEGNTVSDHENEGNTISDHENDCIQLDHLTNNQ